jgi:hypothetical protein
VRELYDDLLHDLKAEHGLLLDDWQTVAADVQPRVLAVVYAPIEGQGPVTYLRPIEDLKQAIVVLNDIRLRLRRFAAGDPDVFQSFDPVTNRRVAIIYDQGRS